MLESRVKDSTRRIPTFESVEKMIQGIFDPNRYGGDLHSQPREIFNHFSNIRSALYRANDEFKSRRDPLPMLNLAWEYSVRFAATVLYYGDRGEVVSRSLELSGEIKDLERAVTALLIADANEQRRKSDGTRSQTHIRAADGEDHPR